MMVFLGLAAALLRALWSAYSDHLPDMLTSDFSPWNAEVLEAARAPVYEKRGVKTEKKSEGSTSKQEETEAVAAPSLDPAPMLQVPQLGRRNAPRAMMSTVRYNLPPLPGYQDQRLRTPQTIR